MKILIHLQNDKPTTNLLGACFLSFGYGTPSTDLVCEQDRYKCLFISHLNKSYTVNNLIRDVFNEVTNTYTRKNCNLNN